MSRVVSFVRQPIVVALVLIVLLLYLGEALSPGFATGGQILRLLIVASLLGIVAAARTSSYSADAKESISRSAASSRSRQSLRATS